MLGNGNILLKYQCLLEQTRYDMVHRPPIASLILRDKGQHSNITSGPALDDCDQKLLLSYVTGAPDTCPLGTSLRQVSSSLKLALSMVFLFGNLIKEIKN